MDRTLSGANTPGQSKPESDGNKGVLRIPQSSCITGASQSDYSMSYPEHLLGTVLTVCGDAHGVFYSLPQAEWAIKQTSEYSGSWKNNFYICRKGKYLLIT